jgi:predicted site-specific integrase-resolvase
MKLIDYAHKMGISYKTAWRWYKAGKLPGKQMDTGTILVIEDESVRQASAKVAVYARVSSADNTSNLDSQAERLVTYCAARGYQVGKVVKEVGSGINDARPKFLALLADQSIGVIVVEHKDRGTRFGFRYIETLLQVQGRQIEVVHQAENSTEDLLADLTSIILDIVSFLYGRKKSKEHAEQINACVEQIMKAEDE